MNIPALFINRPVATTLLAIAIGLSGLLAYFHLPVAPLPNVTFPVIVVQATMAGASPDIMASTVAEPLERRLATIAGVTELTSIQHGRLLAGCRPVRAEPRYQRRRTRCGSGASRRRAPICPLRCAITPLTANTTPRIHRSSSWR